VVPRAWALVYGVLSHQVIGEAVPRAWIDRWQPHAPHRLPDAIRDIPSEDAPRYVRTHNREQALRALEQAERAGT
jgi:hypothetical protein